MHALAAAGLTTYLTGILNRRQVDELQDLLHLAAELSAEKGGVLRPELLLADGG